MSTINRFIAAICFISTAPLRHGASVRAILAGLICPFLLSNAWTAESGRYTTLEKECVVLLHGLSRTDFSMQKMARILTEEGYTVSNVHYDSRDYNIQELANLAVNEGITDCLKQEAGRIHFATHSLGGILVRYFFKDNTIEELGRVVMLAPPNHGSQIIDVFGNVPGFELFTGEPASQLGTSGPESIPANLPPVSFELGVIAGNRSISPIFSLALPDRDDGKVTVESTKIEGMQDFIEVPYTHTFIMQRDAVIQQVIHFLQAGTFNHTTASSNL
ncbi:MAG: alpha/beta hydrolase [Pseudohongiella sp.]|nr:alpha/beta hydrolase [Pseudohongiella sp.]